MADDDRVVDLGDQDKTTTIQATFTDLDLARIGQAVINFGAGAPIRPGTIGAEALTRIVEEIGRAVKDGVSAGFCFKCRCSKDIEGLARFPNGMDGIFAHELQDAIGYLRLLHNLATVSLPAIADKLRNLGGEDDAELDEIAGAIAPVVSDPDRCRRLVKAFDDRVRIYAGIIAEFRREEAANEPPDGYEPDDDGFEVVD